MTDFPQAAEDSGRPWDDEFQAALTAALAEETRPLEEQARRLSEQIAGFRIDLAVRERAGLSPSPAGGGTCEFWAAGEWAEVEPGLHCRVRDYMFVGSPATVRLPAGVVLEFRREAAPREGS